MRDSSRWLVRAIVGELFERKGVLHIPPRAALERSFEAKEVARIGNRQFLERHGIEQREHRGIDADSDRDRQDRDERESRVSSEHSQRVAGVLPQAPSQGKPRRSR